MKIYTCIITIMLVISLLSTASATVLNGQLNVLVNDGTNFKVILHD